MRNAIKTDNIFDRFVELAVHPPIRHTRMLGAKDQVNVRFGLSSNEIPGLGLKRPSTITEKEKPDTVTSAMPIYLR